MKVEQAVSGGGHISAVTIMLFTDESLQKPWYSAAGDNGTAGGTLNQPVLGLRVG